MPSVSEKQRRFFGAELGRERAGEETETGLSEEKLEDFARKGGKLVRELQRPTRPKAIGKSRRTKMRGKRGY